uniref:Bro b n=1 Tax=Spodoptera frugiperda granulovirus TaxID=307454 RepID=A0A346QVX5_9BBAC|nr:bro b [Spodoptera frugiperda granulovirus]
MIDRREYLNPYLSTTSTVSLPLSTMSVLSKQTFSIGDKNCELWIAKLPPTDKNPTEPTFMYAGKAIANFLGYVNTRDALIKNVLPQWRKTWQEIINVDFQRVAPSDSLKMTSQNIEALSNVPANWHPHTVFISEAGVYALIMRSRLPEAIKFQEWLFEEVLPTLRRTGQYAAPKTSKYLKQIMMLQNELLSCKKIEQSLTIESQKYQLALRETQQGYERQIAEYKEREYRHLVKMEEMKRVANTTLVEYGVNALLAKDNIEENIQLRANIEKVQHRIVPEMSDIPQKEHYTTCFVYVKNGKMRVRITRNQYEMVERMDKIMEQFKDPYFCLQKVKKQYKQYEWLKGAEKFLQVKCPNAISLWNKVKELYPQMYFGFKFTNKSRADIEFLTEDEIRDKYKTFVKMCEDNRKCDQAIINRFKALNLVDEEDAVRKCFTPSIECKERFSQIINDTIDAIKNEVKPQREAKRSSDAYTPEDVVSYINDHITKYDFNFTNPIYVEQPPTCKSIKQ